MPKINDMLYRVDFFGDLETAHIITADNEKDIYTLNSEEKVVYVKGLNYFRSLQHDTFIYFKTREQAIRNKEVKCEDAIKCHKEQIEEQQKILNKLKLLRENITKEKITKFVG